MTRKITLLFGVHAHQPAGNFESVLDDAHARCYRPYFDTVYRYPAFRFAVHFSGWLLAYLQERFPGDMEKLHEMVARGQVEVFGGGDTEPVLASIPERDRRSQLAAMADRLERSLGQRPSGAWLTERVWESAVAPALADSGIRYVTVDDYHFLCAGRRPEELTGYFSTEEGGIRLDLFPISEALRYRLPFSPAADAVRYIESLAHDDGAAAAIYFDDIEKLGIWPETHEWVYEGKWLEHFIEGVLASPVISTAHYRDYHRAHLGRGVVYLPATSYIEMNEWTLPADRANEWAELVAQEKAAGRYEARKPLIRGGIWRNFLSRYPEANWMHKRMLQLSGRAAALGAGPPRLRELLHLAQANDAYWHGLFGGLYLPHLRRAVWNAIVELEAMLDRLAPRSLPLTGDIDLDGATEILLGDDAAVAALRDDGFGGVHEFDVRRLRHNFGDTLARREEHYYRRIREGASGGQAGEGIASAHDRVRFRHPISPDDLAADAAPRLLFSDRARRGGGAFATIRYSTPVLDGGRVALRSQAWRLTKTVEIAEGALVVAYRFDDEPAELETEINLAMPSCDGVLGRYVIGGEVPGGFGQSFAWERLDQVTLEDGVLGGRIRLGAQVALSLRAAPHCTVSQSEDGFEKIMQAVCLVARWHAPYQRILLEAR